MEELASVQKFIEIQGWLLLTFFIYLHNQSSSFNTIIVQKPEKRDSSVDYGAHSVSKPLNKLIHVANKINQFSVFNNNFVIYNLEEVVFII